MKTKLLTIGLIINIWVMGNTIGANAQLTPALVAPAPAPIPPAAAVLGTIFPGAAGTLAGILSFLSTVQGYLTPLTQTVPFNTAIAEVLKNTSFGTNPAGAGVTGAASVIGSNGQMTGNTAVFGNLLIQAMQSAKARNGGTAADEIQQSINQASIYGANTQAYAGSKNTASMIDENSPFFTTGSDPNTVYQSNLDATTHTAQIVARQGVQLNNISAQNTLTQTSLGILAEGQQQDRQRATAASAQADQQELAVAHGRRLAASIRLPK
jgi:hypothetical protein